MTRRSWSHYRRSYIPKDPRARRLIILAIGLAASIYLCRASFIEIYLQYNLLLALYLIFFAPVVIAVVLGLPALLFVRTLSYGAQRGNSQLPGWVLLGGVLVACVFPVPPMREATLFVDRRADYERLVELARTGQLQHAGSCRADDVFGAPPGYAELVDRSGCIFVYAHAVEIDSPFHAYVSLTWSDGADRPDSDFCRWNGGVMERIDPHWFVCKRDYN